jgi:hypothetical protein
LAAYGRHYGYAVDHSGLNSLLLCVYTKRDVGCGYEGVAWYKKRCFARFCGLQYAFTAVFFEVTALKHLHFFATHLLEALHGEVWHSAGVSFHKYGVGGFGFL